jgi:hypothetical protein
MRVIYLDEDDPFRAEVEGLADLDRAAFGELVLTALAGSVILLAVDLEKLYLTRSQREKESTDRQPSAWRSS